MKPKSKLRRSMVMSAVAILITASAFTRLTGLENIRAIHIVTLLVCGMGIGVFLVNLALYIKAKE
jgi:hypothetical protein